MKWLLEQVDRFWPDWFIVLWARSAIALGAIFALIAIIKAVRYYGFGHPMLNSKTHEPFSAMGSMMWFLVFGGGGAFFFMLGILTHRWKFG